MTTKRLLIILLIGINCYTNCGAALRRTPKVYNALITTDENLVSSRAYPVIQPTIHETGVAHYPFGGPFNPYGFYGGPFVRFGQAIAPGLGARQQLPYPLPQSQFPPQIMRQPPPSEPVQPAEPPQYSEPPTNPIEQVPPEYANAPVEQETTLRPTTTNAPIPTEIVPNENASLPLNEYGLPPSLIPLPQYNSNQQQNNPINLPPYPFKQYPLLYDPLTGYNDPYLPPYQYLRPNGFPEQQVESQSPLFRTQPLAQPQYQPQQQQLQPQPQPQPEQVPAPTNAPNLPQIQPPAPALPIIPQPEANVNPYEPNSSPLEEAPAPTFADIRNGSYSDDNTVPDVPPPPIPSGAKSKST